MIVTLDADLQDDPRDIPRFLEKLAEGYEVVSGWRRRRRDPLSKTASSRLFNAAVARTTGVRLHDVNCGFKAYRREALAQVRLYGELHRFIPVLTKAQGFDRVTEIPVEHHPRLSGRSKYGALRFFRGLMDLFTILFLTRYLQRPLHLFGGIGALLTLGGLCLLTYLTILWFSGEAIGHRPLLTLGVLCLLMGVQLVMLGLMAELMIHITAQDEGTRIERVLE